MAIEAHPYLAKRDKNIIYTEVFVGIIAVGTLILFGVNRYLIQSANALEVQITEINTAIEEVKQDKRLQVQELIEINSVALIQLSERSQIVSYIQHLKLISKAYGVLFDGFNYSDGAISTGAKILPGDRGGAHTRFSKFVHDYRINPEAKFDLPFISSISGHDSIDFSVNFTIK